MTRRPDDDARVERLRNPESLAKVRAHLAFINRDPEVRQRRIASMLRNKAGMRRIRATARVKIERLNADPARKEIRAACEAKRAAAFRLTCARKLGSKYGFPPELADEFRKARRRGPQDASAASEAVAVLRASYPAAFVALDAAARLKRRRAAPPMPAPGTEALRSWVRQVAEGRA